MSSMTLIPSARRLMTSLRGLPYDLPGAVADLVDNSLDADARLVEIDLRQGSTGAFSRIADDGVGMTERQLDEAMRYGSSRDYDVGDLGHFGLGLKTASLSQCRSLTVATRSTPRGRIRVRRWDLDRVSERDAWILERPRITECPDQLCDPIKAGTGTVVLWDKLDHILGRLRADGDAAARRLLAAADEISAHLAMAFHRFLSGEADGPRLVITVHGRQVEPWDPFARSEPLTQRLPTQRLRLEHAGHQHTVRLVPYILPSQHHFSTPQAHLAAGGPQRWNRQQGLYIYRRDRLVQSGGWNRLRTLDEHSKLARISLDIPPEADGAFRTDVAKMHVRLPEDLRPALRVVIAGVVTRAQEVYRQRVQLVPDRNGGARAAPPESLGLADHWSTITSVLEQELGDYPELLDRVLVALINAQPSAGAGEPEAEGVAA